jgi:molecular chaperone HtpG
MTTETAPQEFQFQAEIQQLLHLLSHSLYQNKEIAIRELISNASDALDKFRHIALTDNAQDDESALTIWIEPDEEKRILVIRDNGIGMTHEELVKNLGTIAHSGSLDYFKQLADEKRDDISLIGQFGVGFYSSFMLADKVEVLTRSFTEETGWRWKSDGTGKFHIEPAEGLERGTQICLHLKEDLDEFARPIRLKHILTEYSTFVPYPIRLSDEHVNEQKPIWVEPKSQITDEQYHNFYKHLSKRSHEEPSWHLHLTADSPFQFHSILFCPPTNMELMGFGKEEHGLHLCAKRILVQNNNRELLPEYLRFIHGLVDSADLPLNVSREALQDNTIFRKIRKVLVKRVLSHLQKMSTDDTEAYLKFYEQFGVMLREGIATDFESRDSLAKLLRFRSSNGDDRDAMISLDDYVSRASEEQEQIYYISGVDIPTIERNPNLEAFRSRGLEVIYLTDPVDEFVLNHLGKFDEKDLVPVDSSDVKFPEKKSADGEEKSDDEKSKDDSESAAPAGFETVVALFKEALGDKVSEVKESKRLTTSPCCLVNQDGGLSAQLQKVLGQSGEGFPTSARILELNTQHPLVQKLAFLAANADHAAFVQTCGQQLYTNAMLADGNIPDPHEASDRILGFMQELADGRSPIAGA